ncbi:MAG: multicopper oxidase domain-containing protein [Dermatophilaceae bacterium]
MTLLAEDAVVSDPAISIQRDLLLAAGVLATPSSSPQPGSLAIGAPTQRRVVPGPRRGRAATPDPGPSPTGELGHPRHRRRASASCCSSLSAPAAVTLTRSSLGARSPTGGPLPARGGKGPAWAVTDPLVPADLTEPVWDRRIPATVLWTEPGERLRVHVLNADTAPHSLHVHGLAYGIDSDGSWPFGVAAVDGRRSDAICPGEQWCYTFDITPDTVGAWPFHDHVQNIEASADRGLFGGIIVRDPTSPKPDLEVPFFLHRMVGSGGDPLFDSGQLAGGDTFAHPFPAAGTFDYVCRLHPMTGTVRVVPGGAATAAVAIVDAPTPAFVPADVTWVLVEPSPGPMPGPCRTRSATPRPRPWTRSRSTGARSLATPRPYSPKPVSGSAGTSSI